MTFWKIEGERPELICISFLEQKIYTGRDIREFKKTTTATAAGTSLNKRFNEQNNGCARAL